MLPLAAMLACTNASAIRDQAISSTFGSEIVAVTPSPGAVGVRPDVTVVLALGTQTKGVLPTITLRGPSGADLELTCALDNDGDFVRCAEVDDLGWEQDYAIRMSFPNGDTFESTFSTIEPESPSAYLLTSATVEKLGKKPETAAALDALFGGSDLVAALTNADVAAGQIGFLIGPASLDTSVAVTAGPGFTFAHDVTVHEGGFFQSDPRELFLPIFVDTEFVQALVTQCRISGTIEANGISGLTIEGIIPAVSLVDLAEPLGVASDLVLNRIELDADLDGDGEADGATFEVQGDPPEIPLSDPR